MNRLILVAAVVLAGAGAIAPQASGALVADATFAPPCLEHEGYDMIVAPDDPGEPDPELDACFGKIQPGARMTSPAGCTMNWVVRDSAGALYIGTAGHCVGTGATVSVWGVGPIGKVAWRMCCGSGNDFALVKIDPALYDRVDPTLCEWGGPSAMGAPDGRGEGLLVYGFGLIYGENQVTRARAGVSYSQPPSYLQYVGMMQPGDSGAPVMTADGEAAGIHVMSTLSAVVVRVDPSFKIATRLDWGLDQAGQALGTEFTLVTSDVPVTLLDA